MALHYLLPRSGALSSMTNATCPMPTKLTEVEQPFVGNMTFYHFNMILSGICTLITCVLIFSLKMDHATHFSVPNEQLKIMRIINMLPAYSITSFLAICFPNAYVYLEGWTEVFQGLALYSFHMLLIDFLGPTEKKRDEFFGNLKVKKIFRKNQYREGLTWLKLSYYSTLQYPIVVFWVAVGQSVAQAFGRYCLDSNGPLFAHIWLEVIQEVSVTIAINAVIRFYANTKDYMKEHQPLLKLLSFKLMVGLIFLEQIIFMVLEGQEVFKPTSKLSYADVHMGIPTMVICVQMVPFAVFIHYAFNTKPYRIGKRSSESAEMLPEADEKGRPIPRAYQGGPGGIHAWLAYMNPIMYTMEAMSMYRTLHHIHVRNQKPIYKSDLDAEKTSSDSDTPGEDSEEDRTHSESLLSHEQRQNGQSQHGRNDSYQETQVDQSQPLMPQTQYPAQTHYPEQAYDPHQETQYPAQAPYATQAYDPPQGSEYQQGQWGQAQYVQPQHEPSQQYGHPGPHP